MTSTAFRRLTVFVATAFALLGASPAAHGLGRVIEPLPIVPPTTPALNGARGVAASPDGAHVYVAAEFEDAISVFARDAGTGALTFVEVQVDGVGPVTGLTDPRGLAFSPDGAFVLN